MSVVLRALEEIGKEDGTRYSGGRKSPWCTYFILWLFREQGSPLPGDEAPTLERASPLAWPAALYALGQKHRVVEPKAGDLVFLRQKTEWGETHCALVVEVRSTGHVVTVDGNHAGKVARVERSANDPRILCFARFQRDAE
jgi:hypothetical protein